MKSKNVYVICIKLKWLRKNVLYSISPVLTILLSSNSSSSRSAVLIWSFLPKNSQIKYFYTSGRRKVMTLANTWVKSGSGIDILLIFLFRKGTVYSPFGFKRSPGLADAPDPLATSALGKIDFVYVDIMLVKVVSSLPSPVCDCLFRFCRVLSLCWVTLMTLAGNM